MDNSEELMRRLSEAMESSNQASTTASNITKQDATANQNITANLQDGSDQQGADTPTPPEADNRGIGAFSLWLSMVMERFNQSIALMSNIARRGEATNRTVMGNLRDDSGQSGGRPQTSTSSSRPLIVAAGGALLLCAAVSVAAAIFFNVGGYFPRKPLSTGADPDQGLAPAAAFPAPAGADRLCDVQFISPTSGDEMPGDGPLNITWSTVDSAASYSLQVIQPPGAGVPWLIQTQDTSKKLYMENFPAGGEYRLVVSALAGDKQALCSTELKVDKAASLIASRPREGDAANGAPGSVQGTTQNTTENTTASSPADDTVDYGSCACDGGPEPIVK